MQKLLEFHNVRIGETYLWRLYNTEAKENGYVSVVILDKKDGLVQAQVNNSKIWYPKSIYKWWRPKGKIKTSPHW